MRTERVGFALCGSFCTHEKALTALKRLTEEYETVPEDNDASALYVLCFPCENHTFPEAKT